MNTPQRNEDACARRRALMAALALVFGLSAVAGEPIAWETPPPPGNAALIYFRAFLVFTPHWSVSSPADRDAREFAHDRLNDEGVYDDQVLAPWIASNHDTLDLLLQGAMVKECDFGVQFDQGPNALLPELPCARALGRLGGAAVAQSLLYGDNARAVELFEAVTALARGVGRHGTIVGSLNGAAIMQPLFLQAPALLGAISDEAPLLERVGRAFDGVRPVLTDLSDAFEGEIKLHMAVFPAPGSVKTREDLLRYAMLADVWAMDTDEARQDADALRRVIAGEDSPRDREAVAAFLNCGVEELATPEGIGNAMSRCGAALIPVLERLQAVVALPYIEGRREFDAIIDASKSHPIESLFVSGLWEMCYHRARLFARLDMLRAAVVLLESRAVQGSLPASLPEGWPADPFTDGKAFGYTVLDTGGFTLSSEGRDRSDRPLSFTVRPGSRS